MTTKSSLKSSSSLTHDNAPGRASKASSDRAFVAKDSKAEPPGQQSRCSQACRHFATFIIFALALFLGLSLMFRGTQSTTPRSTGMAEVPTVRRLGADGGVESRASTYEYVTTSQVPTYENGTTDTLQGENV